MSRSLLFGIFFLLSLRFLFVFGYYEYIFILMNGFIYASLFDYQRDELPDAVDLFDVVQMIMPTDLRCPKIFDVAIMAFPSENVFGNGGLYGISTLIFSTFSTNFEFFFGLFLYLLFNCWLQTKLTLYRFENSK